MCALDAFAISRDGDRWLTDTNSPGGSSPPDRRRRPPAPPAPPRIGISTTPQAKPGRNAQIRSCCSRSSEQRMAGWLRLVPHHVNRFVTGLAAEGFSGVCFASDNVLPDRSRPPVRAGHAPTARDPVLRHGLGRDGRQVTTGVQPETPNPKQSLFRRRWKLERGSRLGMSALRVALGAPDHLDANATRNSQSEQAIEPVRPAHELSRLSGGGGGCCRRRRRRRRLCRLGRPRGRTASPPHSSGRPA